MESKNAAVGLDFEARLEHLTRGSDLSQVAELLTGRRDEILGRWIVAAAAQPFHVRRRDGSVADHIPELFDAVVRVLRRSAPRWVATASPLDDPEVLDAAKSHARRRFEQGLAAPEIVTEFRLLRQEIGRALRLHLPDGAPPDDVIAAELLVNDTLDGAISLALSALTRQIEELREEFLATIVHDLRQPITTIKGQQQLALRHLAGQQPDLQQAADLLRRADAEVDRLGRLVGQLSDASRFALGRLDVERTNIQLKDLVREAVERLDTGSKRRVQLDIPEDLDTRGDLDAELTERVIGNLLSNAFKYSPPESPIQIGIRGDASALHVTVRDHGIGLTSDEMARLFRRYSRAQGAIEQRVDGLGLGLYLSRGIIEAHGGRIWAESDGRNHGATFHVLLPRSIVGGRNTDNPTASD